MNLHSFALLACLVALGLFTTLFLLPPIWFAAGYTAVSMLTYSFQRAAVAKMPRHPPTEVRPLRSKLVRAAWLEMLRFPPTEARPLRSKLVRATEVEMSRFPPTVVILLRSKFGRTELW